jgi:hypothetical protein
MFITDKASGYFKRVNKYPHWRFILELTVLCFILKVISAGILGDLLIHFGFKFYSADLDFNKSLLKTSILWSILSIPFFAALETLWGQWFLLWVSSKFTQSSAVQIIFSTVLFSLAHVDIFQIVAVYPIGAVLAWVFLQKRKNSKWEAFWVTTTIHAFHNYLAMFLLWLSIH